ncbi:putative O-methylsterigmatocystin oxidoreductase [Lineolata rhizophorae]|uniref:Putative O-methylsterigmatocystin oxidoreductase n=1 Tax=Lineolata rhizophorae TaxID=578093 RepID=A0A6A6NWA4_9PEZI|nr:putative O-methylsterigmatocystin oxidoreductase [Lineolata rhizophorae]
MDFLGPSSVAIGIVAFAGLFILYVFTKQTPPKGFRRIPGPKSVPIVGNIFQLSSQPQKELQLWARQYGELFQLKLGTEQWICLNSPSVVKELLDKQSAVTSGRVPMPVASDLLLTPKMSRTFMPSQEFEAKQLIWDILTDNHNETDFYMHVRRYATSVIMTSTYGKRIPKWECEDVRKIYGVMKDFSESIAPGTFLADLIPPLANIPTWRQTWRKRALLYQKRQASIWMRYWTRLCQQIADKRGPDCFVKQIMDTEFQKLNTSELQGVFLAGFPPAMIEAGSETTSSALNSVLKYLAANPATIQCAHAEIASVVGDSRSPTFADEESLSYVRAIVKEVLRLRPSTDVGTLHYATQAVTYKDYYIPANTVLVINHYALQRDPARYSEPDLFMPERFLNHPHKAGYYSAHPDPYVRDHFSFGAGPCSSPLPRFSGRDLLPPLGPDGKELALVTDDDALEEGTVTIPKIYRLRFVPRNAKVEQTLRNEWDAACRDGYFLGSVKVTASGVETS